MTPTGGKHANSPETKKYQRKTQLSLSTKERSQKGQPNCNLHLHVLFGHGSSNLFEETYQSASARLHTPGLIDIDLPQ